MVKRSHKFYVLSATLVLAVLSVSSLQAQTLNVLHSFNGKGGPAGYHPYAGMTMDAAGNLYGTTLDGGSAGCACGIVFELKHAGSGWVLLVLYSFQGGNDGALPEARVVFGPDGNLYGTTTLGGDPSCVTDPFYPGCGTVFKLQPPATACAAITCPWTETVLHRFENYDGALPTAEVVFDAAGNLYGTTFNGGIGNCIAGCGAIYELSPDNGSWSGQPHSLLHWTSCPLR